MADPLEPLRAQIDRFDREIVKLLNERARVVVEIGKVKQQHKLEIYASDREKAVFEKVRALNDGPLPNRCLEAVYRELMSGSFALERPLRIGYLGPAASFSHQAALSKFGSSVEHLSLATIGSVFEAVARGNIDYGIVPIENSLHGGVAATLDAFVGTTVRIYAEVLMKVQHNVLSRGAWDHVRQIATKDEVFSQCRKWMAEMAGAREIVKTDSTSRAAEMAQRDPTIAAIASSDAAKLYELSKLFQNIEDNPNNTTRFFVIGRENAKRTGHDKTGILFTTKDEPGALAEVLNVFHQAGINLTGLEKRSSQTQNWQYHFFVEAVGHLDDTAMQQAIADTRRQCIYVNVLGSYPQALSSEA